MILTSHRLDCFSLAVECLLKTKSVRMFDRVVLLLSGVEGRHLDYVNNLVATRKDIPWDIVSGPRGKKKFVANLQNECVRRYPDGLYFKLDEDMFVPDGWAERLLAGYNAYKDDPAFAMVTTVIPNHGLGAHFLLNHYPELLDEYHRHFTFPVVPDYQAPIWHSPRMARFMMRPFLDVQKSSHDLVRKKEAGEFAPFETFSFRFCINVLLYDYRHWTEMGGIPDDEEPAWAQWIVDNKKFNVLVTDSLVQHYSYFVQQDNMDRSHIMEDLRRVNMPGTIGGAFSWSYQWPWVKRVLLQAPRALRRKARHLLGLKPDWLVAMEKADAEQKA